MLFTPFRGEGWGEGWSESFKRATVSRREPHRISASFQLGRLRRKTLPDLILSRCVKMHAIVDVGL